MDYYLQNKYVFSLFKLDKGYYYQGNLSKSA